MPRGVKRLTPLFIICKRRGCGGVRQVRCPNDQTKQKYCSRRCASLVNRNVLKGAAKGGRQSVVTRRQQAIARVKGLSPLDAFRIGYKRGLYSKLLQIRRRYILIERRIHFGDDAPQRRA